MSQGLLGQASGCALAGQMGTQGGILAWKGCALCWVLVTVCPCGEIWRERQCSWRLSEVRERGEGPPVGGALEPGLG